MNLHPFTLTVSYNDIILVDCTINHPTTAFKLTSSSLAPARKYIHIYIKKQKTKASSQAVSYHLKPEENHKSFHPICLRLTGRGLSLLACQQPRRACRLASEAGRPAPACRPYGCKIVLWLELRKKPQ